MVTLSSYKHIGASVKTKATVQKATLKQRPQTQRDSALMLVSVSVFALVLPSAEVLALLSSALPYLRLKMYI